MTACQFESSDHQRPAAHVAGLWAGLWGILSAILLVLTVLLVAATVEWVCEAPNRVRVLGAVTLTAVFGVLPTSMASWSVTEVNEHRTIRGRTPFTRAARAFETIAELIRATAVVSLLVVLGTLVSSAAWTLAARYDAGPVVFAAVALSSVGLAGAARERLLARHAVERTFEGAKASS